MKVLLQKMIGKIFSYKRFSPYK